MRNILFILLSMVFVFTSCKQDSIGDEYIGNERVQYIDVDLNAMILANPNKGFTKSGSSKNLKISNQFYDHPNKIEKLNDIYFSELVVEQSDNNSDNGIRNLKQSAHNKFSALPGNNMVNDPDNPLYKPLEVGVRYMVLIFDDEDNHIGTSLRVVGENNPIPVRFREDYVFSTSNYYRIVVFTFNTKNDSDFNNLNLDPSQTNNNPQINFPSDKGFFYHNGSFLLDPDENYETVPKLNVVLLPQTVKVGVTVDARGVNSKVKKISGTFASHDFLRRTARFNLKLNNAQKFDVTEKDYDYTFTVQGDSDSLSVMRYFYMGAADQENVNLNVRLTELNIQSGSEPEVRLIPANTEKQYSFNVDVKSSTYFNARINLMTGFQVGDIVWAYGNLYFDATDVGNQYKIRNDPSDGYMELSTDYWAWKTKTSGAEVDDVGSTDPCSLVYPKNTWRLPTESEAKSLYNDESLISTEVFQRDLGYTSYVEYRHNVSGPALKFYMHGYYHDKDDFVGAEASSYYGMFWLSTGTSLLKDVLMFTVNSVGSTSATPQYNISESLITARHRMNIRCVRTIRN